MNELAGSRRPIAFRRIGAGVAVLVVALAQACTAIQTTAPGALGITRKQYMSNYLSTQEVNDAYAKSYRQVVDKAHFNHTLEEHTALNSRVLRITNRVLPAAEVFRPEAGNWLWMVQVIHSDTMNATCGPGGKILVYSGIVERLQLTDAEIAAILGHEIAHALREHGREAMSKAAPVSLISNLAVKNGADQSLVKLANMGVALLMTLPNSRQAESEADMIGLELMARAGYDPHAAISLWRKMQAADQGMRIEFMSTHPGIDTRITQIQQAIPKVLSLYLAAARH